MTYRRLCSPTTTYGSPDTPLGELSTDQVPSATSGRLAGGMVGVGVGGGGVGGGGLVGGIRNVDLGVRAGVGNGLPTGMVGATDGGITPDGIALGLARPIADAV